MEFKKMYVVNERASELETFLWGVNFASPNCRQIHYICNEDFLGEYLEVSFNLDEVTQEETFNRILSEMGIDEVRVGISYTVKGLSKDELIAFNAGIRALKQTVPLPNKYLGRKCEEFPYYLSELITEYARNFKEAIDNKEK